MPVLIYTCHYGDMFTGSAIEFLYENLGDQYPQEVHFHDHVGGEIIIKWQDLKEALEQQLLLYQK
jgi:hypothetical protein